MVYSEKLLDIIALMKWEDHHTKKLIWVLPYNCLYENKGNNSSAKGFFFFFFFLFFLLYVPSQQLWSLQDGQFT